MHFQRIFTFLALFITLIAFSGVNHAFAASGGIDSVEKYSRLLDIDLDGVNGNDFINWKPTNGTPVVVSDTAITGEIWGETTGWINLNPTNSPSGSGVTNTCAGELGGYAWGENTGWINFNPTNATGADNPEIDPTTGEITGMVWSQNYGWIRLDSTDGTYPGLVTDWTPGCVTPPDDDDDGGGGGSGGRSVRVIKRVVGGPLQPADFTLHVAETVGNTLLTLGLQELPGSPFSGNSSGVVIGVNTPRVLAIFEDVEPGYVASFSGDCTARGLLPSGFSGSHQGKPFAILFGFGGQATCIITNTYQSSVNTCQDPAANNYGGALPCTYTPDRICEDVLATNYGGSLPCNYFQEDICRDIFAGNFNGPLPCRYDITQVCQDPSALNLGGSLPCRYAATMCQNTGATNYGGPLPCQFPTDYCPEPGIQTSRLDCPNTVLPVLDLRSSIIRTTGPILPIIGWLGLLSSLPGLIARLSNVLLTIAFGRRKTRGVVYDANTKEPLDPAYVSVIDVITGQEIANQITDMEGRFGFVLKEGHYRIVVAKTHYQFPSQRLAGRYSDEIYDHLYFGEPFTVTDPTQVVTMNIPMDPIDIDWNQVEKRHKNLLYYIIKGQTKLGWLFDLLFVLGFILSVIITYFYPIVWNVVMSSLYVIIALFRAYGYGPIKAGTITRGGIPLAYGIVRVYYAGLNREIGHRIISESGAYYVLVPPGHYYMTIEAKNPDGTYSLIHTSETMHTRQGIIHKSINI